MWEGFCVGTVNPPLAPKPMQAYLVPLSDNLPSRPSFRFLSLSSILSFFGSTVCVRPSFSIERDQPNASSALRCCCCCWVGRIRSSFLPFWQCVSISFEQNERTTNLYNQLSCLASSRRKREASGLDVVCLSEKKVGSSFFWLGSKGVCLCVCVFCLSVCE